MECLDNPADPETEKEIDMRDLTGTHKQQIKWFPCSDHVYI